MNSIQELAEHLTDSTTSKQIMDGLRVLGHRASSSGLKRTLAISAALEPQFQLLEERFPSAKIILKEFRRSGYILSLLESSAEFQLSASKFAKYDASAYCISIGSTSFSPDLLSQFPALGELVAFLWLMDASISVQSGITISNDLAYLLSNSSLFIESLAWSTKNPPEIAIQNTIPVEIGMGSWVDYSATMFLKCTVSGPNANLIHEGFKSAANFLIHLSHTQALAEVDNPQYGQHLNIPKKIQRGAGLSERERTNAHHNAFHSNEVKTLAKDLRNNLVHQGKFYSARVDLPTPYFYESLIALLALATGRTIRGALDFSLQSGSNEFISLELVDGHNGPFNYPHWNRSLKNGVKLKIPLPDFFKCLAHRPIRFNSACNIEDCLPFSFISWEDRCLEWLEIVSQTPKHKINRRVRDALSRSLYQNTASSALLDWLTSPIEKLHKYPEAQSYYLNPHARRTFEAYSEACTSLFNKYGANKYFEHIPVNDIWGVPTSEQRKIVSHLLGEMKAAENSNNIIEQHNTLAHIVLLILVVATGHRKSTTPFFFRWDIVHRDNLVFICDKLVIGSEARFVPIPKWLKDIVVAYWAHLESFIVKLRPTNPSLAIQIEQILSLNTYSSKFQSIESDTSLPPILGQFFQIDSRYSARTISTRDLEKFYSPVSKKGIGELRKSIANFFWKEKLSGHQIEAFLGHNAEMHSFGQSSAWTINSWSASIRETQEQYLANGGWKNIIVDSIVNTASSIEGAIPSFNNSLYSYEGRDLSNKEALHVARQIVYEVLPSEWFIHDGAEITESDARTLEDTVRDRLSDNNSAHKKVSQAIAELLLKLRAYRGRDISVALSNLTRIEPGPICVSSSRYLAISAKTRDWWVEYIGRDAPNSVENDINRLASIGISLVIFDAILDEAIFKSALQAIVSEEITAVGGCIHIKFDVEKATRAFTRSIILSPITSAQIIGFKNTRNKPYIDLHIQNITKRIEKQLKSAPHTEKGLTLSQLILVFKSWWIIRLPGSAFSIAIGNHSGPAPESKSECALYGIKTANDYLTITSSLNRKSTKPVKLDSTYAKRLFNQLLGDARGSFELKQQTNKRQRNRLLKLLNDSDEYADLKNLATEQPIVGAMLGFLQHLLENGGKKVAIYAYNSLHTYYSKISRLLDAFWDCSFEMMEADDFDKAYLEIVSVSPQAELPIKIFHQYLRETMDVPASKVTNALERSVIHCRSAVITQDQFVRAWEATKSLPDDGQIISHTKTYLSIGYDYGLRSKEILGLESRNIFGPRPLRIQVARNNVRDLKTKKYSLRMAHPLIASSKRQKHIDLTASLSAASPSKNYSIFANESQRGELYPRFKISQATTTLLRLATGNLAVVPYSMRHSAATRLAHFIIPAPRNIPLSTEVNIALMDTIDPAETYSLFTDGFHAWPFWSDRIGMHLGHAGVDTLLNTYWHTSHIHLASHTWHAAENISLTVQQIANMLGKERTTISKQLSSINKELNAGANSNLETLVANHIRKANLPEFGANERDFERSVEIGSQLVQNQSSQDYANKWIAFDRMLCQRMADKLSFNETIELSDQFNISTQSAKDFIEAYKLIVSEYGFDYFEHNRSELLTATSKQNQGTLRGAAERELGISKARAAISASESYSQQLELFSRIWLERTDPENPWFVGRNTDEIRTIIDVLLGMGAIREQFEFSSNGFELTSLRNVLNKSELDKVIDSKIRLSTGPKNARVSELGVRIGQLKNSKIGDYRDTHRLALVITAIVQSNHHSIAH